MYGLLPDKQISEKYVIKRVIKNPEIVNVKYNGVLLKNKSNHTTTLPINGITLKKLSEILYKREIIAKAIEINIAWYILNDKYGVIFFLVTLAKINQITLKKPNVK